MIKQNTVRWLLKPRFQAVSCGVRTLPPKCWMLNAGFAIFAILCLVSSINAQDLRWGGDAEGGAPYLLPNPKNPREIIGFEIDLMDAVGKQLNRKSVFVQNQWDG